MKLNETKSDAFITTLASVGQSYDYSDILHGISWLASDADDVLGSLRGLGRLGAGGTSVMDAVIQNAGEMNAKMVALDKARGAAARVPGLTEKMRSAVVKNPATVSETQAIVKAMNDAAKLAVQAKNEKAKAEKVLAQGDTRAAAALAVQAISTARDAATLANRAEKTRLTSQLDKVAATLNAQAGYIEGVVRVEQNRTGMTTRLAALMATAQSLREQARSMTATSAVVAQVDPTPPQAPTQARVAEVANRFNVRTAHHRLSPTTIAVLADLSNNALAQAKDYDGAVTYYGQDNVGRLAADMEFGRTEAAKTGLRQLVGQSGLVATLPTFSEAERMLARGIEASQQGYIDGVMPAFTGPGALQQTMQKASRSVLGSSLGAVNGLGKAEWDTWCENRASGRTQDVGWGPYAAKGGVDACKKDGIFYSEPWSCKGYLEREAISWTEFAACMAKGVGQWVASGQAAKDIGQVTSTVNQVQTAAKTVTGTPAAGAPPANTRPNTLVQPRTTRAPQPVQVQPSYGSYVPQQAQSFFASIPTSAWVVGGGLAALGLAGAFLMRRRP